MRATHTADAAFQGFGYSNTLLNAGWHVTGIGGSDSHDPDRPSREAGAIGSPTTVVYMPELSVHGLLAGVRSGRAFIDVEGTRNRLLDLSARAGDRQAAMGGTLPVPAGETVRFFAELNGVPSGIIQVIVDGRVAPSLETKFDAAHPIALAPWHSDGGAHWIRVDVRDADGRLLLVGNPIYIVFAKGLKR
ncbi:CehA/McbA family metallohydrolase [Sphingomonas sp. 10B4]|uniref:CehA/McbA family metallohydrolase n=1 Tax=Sphingomonas sp. 10B4 TaxID=3048575 RepID=UPI002AB49707|nr:CehA/McbA family metallohydrolase [Sphingomonas sp. 10B4]MDY7525185.1 CehA/McbA family metallohydrolase [Sphingomonas sp. 10B4]MEB0282010.1 CehA/McbA family metallohydrolase [Sphingomonas sp. 10B4]